MSIFWPKNVDFLRSTFAYFINLHRLIGKTTLDHWKMLHLKGHYLLFRPHVSFWYTPVVFKVLDSCKPFFKTFWYVVARKSTLCISPRKDVWRSSLIFSITFGVCFVGLYVSDFLLRLQVSQSHWTTATFGTHLPKLPSQGLILYNEERAIIKRHSLAKSRLMYI